MNGTTKRAFRTEREKASSLIRDAVVNGRLKKILWHNTEELL